MMGYYAEAVDLGDLAAQGGPAALRGVFHRGRGGFTPRYPRDHVVRNDPRSSTAAEGRRFFHEAVDELAAAAEELMKLGT